MFEYQSGYWYTMILSMGTGSTRDSNPQEIPGDDRQQQEVYVHKLREKYGTSVLPVFQQRIDGFLRIVQKNGKGHLKRLLKNKAQLRDDFARVHVSLQNAWPETNLTPVALCGQLLLSSVYTQLVLEALSYHNAKLAPVFCAQYDYALGFREIAFDLLRADIASKNTDPQKSARDVQEAIDIMKQYWHETPSIDKSLAAYQKLQTEEEQFKAYLSKDATGLLLLDFLVSRLSSRVSSETMLPSPTSAIVSYHSSVLVMAGAAFAAKAYRKLSPLALV